MKVKLQRNMDYAVLIPSAGRPDVLYDTLKRQPFLNASNTIIGIQINQLREYKKVYRAFKRIQYIEYHNPFGSTCVAREELRRFATTGENIFSYYVCADDNTRFEEESLHNLVRGTQAYNQRHGLTVVGGMQGSTSVKSAKPTRFDEQYAKKSGHTVGGYRFYEKIAMMFWCFPDTLYQKIRYCFLPTEVNPGAMEDHTAALACLKLGAHFVTCMDAPFVKKRFQKGGSGNPVARAKKIGLAWERLGELHPEYMAHVRMVWPYAKFQKMQESV